MKKNILAENMRRFATKNLAAQEMTKVTVKIANEGIKNVTPAMIAADPFPGSYSAYTFGGKFNGTYYEWDASNVEGMSGVRGLVRGVIMTANNRELPESGYTEIKDADPNGVCIGFYSNQAKFWCYMNTQGNPVVYSWL